MREQITSYPYLSVFGEVDSISFSKQSVLISVTIHVEGSTQEN